MGRHKKYFTPGEKQEANRAKSRRHYDKYEKSLYLTNSSSNETSRAKDSINERRRSLYTPKKSPIVQSRSAAHENSDQKAKTQSECEVWLDHARRLERRLNKLIGDNALQFMEDLCATYSEDRDHEAISDRMKMLDNLQRLIYRFQDKILQIDGIGDIWKEADTIKKKIVEVLSWVQDIYCTALIDIDNEFAEFYSNRQFIFQNSQE